MIGKSCVRASAWEDTKLPFLFPWKWYVSSQSRFMLEWHARDKLSKQSPSGLSKNGILWLPLSDQMTELLHSKWITRKLKARRDLELITLFQNITIPWHVIHGVILCYVLLFTKAGCYQNVLFVLLLWIILLYKFSPQLREHCSINPLLCFNWLSFSLSN